MKRGRPVHSKIRQNIIEILFFMGRGHGYKIYKHYVAIFPKVTRRSIYYQLKKGKEMGLFTIDKVEKEKGEFSWGSSATKTYYKLGPQAKPVGKERVRKYFESLKLSEKSK
ncbi:MAG: hypothetical protein MAG795_00588 [Candidatus Woesearchaeota archaeon]|nr:hypothetical protein [Candidatus Woesearchaeota archaeon]